MNKTITNLYGTIIACLGLGVVGIAIATSDDTVYANDRPLAWIFAAIGFLLAGVAV